MKTAVQSARVKIAVHLSWAKEFIEGTTKESYKDEEEMASVL